MAELPATKARRRLGAVRREVATFAAVAADRLSAVTRPVPEEAAAQALVASASQRGGGAAVGRPSSALLSHSLLYSAGGKMMMLRGLTMTGGTPAPSAAAVDYSAETAQLMMVP